MSLMPGYAWLRLHVAPLGGGGGGSASKKFGQVSLGNRTSHCQQRDARVTNTIPKFVLLVVLFVAFGHWPSVNQSRQDKSKKDSVELCGCWAGKKHVRASSPQISFAQISLKHRDKNPTTENANFLSGRKRKFRPYTNEQSLSQACQRIAWICVLLGMVPLQHFYIERRRSFANNDSLARAWQDGRPLKCRSRV